MANPYGAPEINVQDVYEKQQNREEFFLIDVREPHELALASLPAGTFINVPLSDLVARKLEALPEALGNAPHADAVLFCHKGMRSAQVTAFLRQQGWSNARSMAGGIDAWAEEIDESVGRYTNP